MLSARASQGPAKRRCCDQGSRGPGASPAQARQGAQKYVFIVSNNTPSYNGAKINLCSDSQDSQETQQAQSHSERSPTGNTTFQAPQAVQLQAGNTAFQVQQEVQLQAAAAAIQLQEAGAELAQLLATLGFGPGMSIPSVSRQRLRELGRGTFGTVYEDRLSNPCCQRYCIKVHTGYDGEVITVKPSELRILEKIRGCTGIIPALAVRVHPGLFCIVMEKYSHDLHDHIHKRGGLPDEKIVLDLLRALEALSERDLTHGDLKPRNILVNPATANTAVKAVITDLGTVSSINAEQQYGAGTPWYVSWEGIFKGAQDYTAEMNEDSQMFQRHFKVERVLPNDLYSLMVTMMEFALKIHLVVEFPRDLYEWDREIQYMICIQIIYKMLDPDLTKASEMLAHWLRPFIGDCDPLQIQTELCKVDGMLKTKVDRYDVAGCTHKATKLNVLRFKTPVTFQARLAEMSSPLKCPRFRDNRTRENYCHFVDLVLRGMSINSIIRILGCDETQ